MQSLYTLCVAFVQHKPSWTCKNDVWKWISPITFKFYDISKSKRLKLFCPPSLKQAVLKRYSIFWSTKDIFKPAFILWLTIGTRYMKCERIIRLQLFCALMMCSSQKQTKQQIIKVNSQQQNTRVQHLDKCWFSAFLDMEDLCHSSREATSVYAANRACYWRRVKGFEIYLIC